MNPTVSKQLEKLLGQVPVSRLPECDKSDQGLYLMYEGNGETKAVKDIDLFTYLFTHVYMFLLKKEVADDSLYLYIDPENYVEDGDTPLTFARKLYNAPEVRPWIDEPHPQERNISEVWFKPFQYHYFDNLDDRLPTMLLKYGPGSITGTDSWWSNSMWESHLDPPKTIQKLPSLTTKTGEMKCLYVPESSVTFNGSGTVDDPENFIWSRFNRRNYIRIVDGGWDAENETDLKWTDEVGSDETNETITDSLGVVHENIGDIDQTLISIGKYLDDAFKSIRQSNHDGKVVFTASTSQDPVNDQEITADRKHWINVLGNSGEEAFVWSGGGNYIGENFNAVPNLPTHHHNIDEKMPIRNISIIGRPEGETVGGTAKVDTAEHIPVETENDTSGRAKDEPKTLTSSNPLFPTRIGAYAGTVVYTDKTVGATQIPHENKPLFYKMRAFYYKTNG